MGTVRPCAALGLEARRPVRFQVARVQAQKTGIGVTFSKALSPTSQPNGSISESYRIAHLAKMSAPRSYRA